MDVPTPTSAHTPYLQAGNGHASLHDAVFHCLLRERIVSLGSQVDDDIANQICAQMLLSADDPHRDVHLYINSPGGSVGRGRTRVQSRCCRRPRSRSALAAPWSGSPGRRRGSPGGGPSNRSGTVGYRP
ncbi:ATP-dependent Clp protease proteolytic subunit [Geodermatophilus obscurus]|uniref:ATP-dependent Clp protease proteolytic subunit n=1 Tax=Geodermatophilus obscurus (strain ATCC 25078 / DSM 43160 / JCM 3152 / CCUG 61914 / KCC A-0152 / KCTC 9177 / NBRC 13315 / NRRL B-3577 / G-20) TaxID=526225 RepID=D2SD97_GEOOG|nr:ATP-dependent Clp protease proteolytic subunit [Geodermatophilus obscurus]ADB76446.1 peptidase S14 ClpP [Geodermatophilus obscurus DSM 43160]